MTFAELPSTAAWHHDDSRTGFEVVVFTTEGPTLTLRGSTAAVEDGEVWAVDYDIALGAGWRTIRARVRGMSANGDHEVLLETDGSGRWLVDGAARPDLDGCLDVDLESSACTNTIPVHRLGLRAGEGAVAPAVYVRAADLAVERLEQRYDRADDAENADGTHQRYDYRAPGFDFTGQIVYDEAGLVLTYPGIATRAR